MFFLGGAVFLLPAPPDTPNAGLTGEASTPALLASAGDTVADLAGFCERRPGVCVTARQVIGGLEARGKYSVRLIYKWADEDNDSPPLLDQDIAVDAPGLTTGSVSVANAGAAKPASVNTLRLEDLIPPWRGPVRRPSKPGSQIG